MQEPRLELLLDAISDYAIFMMDLGGFITTWNKGASRVQGYRQAEIVGQHFSRLFSSADKRQGLPEKILQAARAAGRHESEGWRPRKDGSCIWCDAIVQLVTDEHGEPIGFANVVRDITERKTAQQALPESERRFRLLVNGVLDYAICMLDPSGIVTNWNRGGERQTGYTTEEILGHHFSKFYSNEDRARGLPARALEAAVREGSHEGEGWRVRKDGSRFWASVVIDAIRDDTGELQGFAKVTRDITERRAAQGSLRESERQLRLLVSGVTDYALFMLDPNGIVTTWNAGAQRIKGYSSDEILGQHFSRFYTERDRAAGYPARALHAAANEGRFEAEGWRVRKDGTMFWANAVIDPIYDESGRLIGFAKITRDITERRDAQLALQEAQAERSQALKMEALGQLTGGVAHDFNNLLTIVLGQISRLRSKLADDPTAHRAIEAVETAVTRGAALTRQLLTFSRRQNMKPSILDLRERIESLRTMLDITIGQSIKLATAIPANLWTVKLDPSEFELAVVNLALNARDAMPNGGLITLVAENVVLSPTQTKAKLAGEFAALRISDTGSGIAPDVLPRVFDPFFTTKQAGHGSGLGLSQVHGFTHQSGGHVTIESELGRGTTVTMYFPRVDAEAVPAEEWADSGQAGEGSVLLVEDNPEVAEATASMLEQFGYSVRMAPNADVALRTLDEGEFALVVSDIVIPESMDGLSLARAIRERKPALPVLLITGYYPNAREIGDEFVVLRKPFDMAELSRVAARMIAGANQPATTNVVSLRPPNARARTT
jgi:PAS domain S-box-containing protein